MSCSSTNGSAENTIGANKESGFPGTGCHGTPTSLLRSFGLALSLPEVFSADFEFARHPVQCPNRTLNISQRLRGTIHRSNVGEATCSLAKWEMEDILNEDREHFAKCSSFQPLMWCFSNGSDLPTCALTCRIGDQPGKCLVLMFVL